MSISSLHCYQCGCEYGYVGSTPHPGQCPSCGSHCVSPSGELALTDVRHWDNAAGLSKIWVYTMDERGRRFTFKIAANGSEGKVVRVCVEGVGLNPTTDRSLLCLPPVVSEVAGTYGVTEIETERTVRS